MKNETENIYDMYSALKRMLLHAAVILLILTIARCCFAVAFVPMATITGHTANLGHLVFNALRFDLQVAAYTLLCSPPHLLYSPHPCTDRGKRVP